MSEFKKYEPTDGCATFADFVAFNFRHLNRPIFVKPMGDTGATDEREGDISYGFVNGNPNVGRVTVWRTGDHLMWYKEDRRGSHSDGDYRLSHIATAGDFADKPAKEKAAPSTLENGEGVNTSEQDIEEFKKQRIARLREVKDAAQKLLPQLKPARKDNPVLVKKGLSEYAHLFLENARGNLMIPKYIADRNGRETLCNFEERWLGNETGETVKRPFKTGALGRAGGLSAGTYCKFGRGDPLVICEGALTAASIYIVTGYTVLACFSCNQMNNVKYPGGLDSIRFVGADNGEAGLKAAEHFLQYHTNIFIHCPPAGISDWNDVFNSKGGWDSLALQWSMPFKTKKFMAQREEDDYVRRILGEKWYQLPDGMSQREKVIKEFRKNKNGGRVEQEKDAPALIGERAQLKGKNPLSTQESGSYGVGVPSLEAIKYRRQIRRKEKAGAALTYEEVLDAADFDEEWRVGDIDVFLALAEKFNF